MGLLVKRMGFNHTLWLPFRRGVKAADGAQAIGVVELAGLPGCFSGGGRLRRLRPMDLHLSAIGKTVAQVQVNQALVGAINASTINAMGHALIWDESKRQSNLRKHGLDFAHAAEVLESRYRLDIAVVRGGEVRTQSISYALGFLAVLTVVHTEREGATRVISFRHASNEEREVYDAWLQDE